MEPVGIVMAFVAALYIVGRGPLLFAPASTAAFYGRLFSTSGRVRIFGVLLTLLATALIVTARQARADQGEITFLLEGFGWFTAVAAGWPIAAPGTFQRLMDAFYAPPNELLRGIGALNIVIGIVFGLVAFSVM